jgi:hypothetical protein
MKKTLFALTVLLGLSYSLQAQQFKNAIGLRFGDNDGFGGEVTYQRSLSKNNRLEFDLGWRDTKHYDAAKLVGIYQWVWEIDNGFKWYAGPGVGVGSWRSQYYNNGHHIYSDESGIFLLATGDIGIEYNFKFPLQLSFDVRPEITISSDYNDVRDRSFSGDFGLSARYRF